ncbi:hypothetical protein [Kitasatospora kifunensis]|uniref:Uncharacterized protein n=1 Tax=Kitasatospora kifunensis TaxID=58351 RepID=A0A7W7VTZ5_KITKI|nr:hypothetical protein [Kitasatospora kifunensis]MBB4922139.1 hypothetical protein [Kitasatospora kifunensis]
MSQLTDHRPTVTVGTLYDLNERYLAAAKCSLAVSSRTEIRDGIRFGLGGLNWRVSTPDASYEVVTGEDEVLPDLPVVRAGWPFAFTSDVRGVAA